MASPARGPIRRARRGRPGDSAPYGVRRSSERADHSRELLWVERRSTHERAVDPIRFREFTDGTRTHAPTVENGDGIGIEARTFQGGPDGARRGGGVLARRGVPGADRPDRLVRDDESLES